MKTASESTDKYCDLPLASWPAGIRFLNWFCDHVVIMFAKLYWCWSFDGEEPFKKNEGSKTGVVYIANHASMLDPALLVGYAGHRRNPVRPLYKSELDGSSLIAWFFSRLGAIPIKRGTADMKSVKRAVAALKRGENILVFPEGTRIWDPSERPEIYGGFALIAQMAGADIVPIAVDGTERINPYKKHRVPRPSRVRVRFGRSINFDDVEGGSKREKLAGMEKLAMDRVYEMRAAIRRENNID